MPSTAPGPAKGIPVHSPSTCSVLQVATDTHITSVVSVTDLDVPPRTAARKQRRKDGDQLLLCFPGPRVTRCLPLARDSPDLLLLCWGDN